MNHKLTTIRVRTHALDVFVDTDGRFNVTLDHTGISADTLEGLRKKLMAVTKQKAQALSVPFEQIEYDGKTHPGTVTGVHTNGNFIVRWPGEKGIEQVSWYEYGSTYTRPLTTAQRIEWATLCRERRELDKRVEKFKTEHCISLKTVVQDEMTKLTGTDAKEGIQL